MFDGRRVWKLHNVGGVFLESPMIACAPLVDKDWSPILGAHTPVIRFMGGDEQVHQIAFQPLLDDGNLVDVRDPERMDADGSPIIWRFELLTRDLWLGMGSHVQSLDTLKEDLKTDADVQTFYLDTFASMWNLPEAS